MKKEIKVLLLRETLLQSILSDTFTCCSLLATAIIANHINSKIGAIIAWLMFLFSLLWLGKGKAKTANSKAEAEMLIEEYFMEN